MTAAHIDTKPKRFAYSAIVIYSTIVGLSFLFGKLALTVASPLDSLAHRFTISLVAATIPVLLRWVKLQIQPRDVRAILPLAVLYPSLFFAFQAFGLQFTTSAEAGIIHATVPIFTMIAAAHFLKERATRLQQFSTLLSVAGVILIFVMKGTTIDLTNMKGTLLILLSALSLAGYSVLARKLTLRLNVFAMTYVMTIIGFLVFNLMAVSQHLASGTLSLYFEPIGSPVFLMSILYLGVLSSLGSSLLSNFALSKLEASKVSVFNHLATLVSIVGGFVLLNEQLAYYHIIGAIVIIVGVLGANVKTWRGRRVGSSKSSRTSDSR
ncbi:EamA family transporter [Paenibacillus sp. CGMCC 1.16610]|uniref:EamA family transporter n=1 Tax=Paenibacillus anseongense TaxID=2682845 RepID=A0ABW9UL55_9BACL|nr:MULTISPECIES: DMT family transporter [Paenibacillus]MBA2941074.1 EamA family transporter [Paenibacillus sp. CGMCC 1.16610]MVQ39893.1 EamA family transporter [Paenibacillus anseongense]